MKKNHLPQRVRKSLKFIILLICTVLAAGPLDAQTINSWTGPAANSDYFVNIPYSISPGTPDMNCNYSGEYLYVYIPPSAPINGVYTNFRQVSSSVWTGTATHAVGPNASNTYNLLYQKEGNTDFGFPCGQNAFAATTASTLSLQKVTISSISSNPAGQISLDWTVNTDIPENLYTLEIYIDGNLDETYTSKSQTTHTTGVYATNVDHNIELRTVYSGNPVQTASANATFFVNPPNGKITGTVTTVIGTEVEDVTITATLQNPGDLTLGIDQPQSYTAVTEPDGTYTIPFIYYGLGATEMAQYQIAPTLPDHDFDPESTMRTLKSGDFMKMADFVDTTSYSIFGSVLDVNGCGVDSVFIFDTNDPSLNTFSKPDGTYIFNVPETGNYNLRATLDTIILGTIFVAVTDNIQGQDFNYNETDSLSIFVGAGCFEYIGKADLTIRTKGGCPLQNVQTNLDGKALNLVLPSREITVEITNIYPPASEGLDVQDILDDIGAPIPIDLDSTTQLDVFYRKPLSFQFSGIPAPPCPAVSTPVFDQARSYYISIQVWESQGICAADTGYIVVQDNIASIGSQSTILDTIPISNGFALYNLVPGEPVLAAPYLKSITFTAVVDSQMVTQTIQGIVSGARQRTATFVTGAPVELPYMILRDPPGDASYSFFNETATTTYAMSHSVLTGTNVKAWAKLAVASNALFVKVFGEIGGGITVGGSKNDITEYKTTLSHNLGIQTSSEQNVIGEDGDVVYGAAVNFIYGLVDERYFDINTCAVQVDTAIMFSPDTFATKFVKTIKGIRENLIPDLNFLATNPDTTEEARRKFRNEARKWEQVIQMNEDMKADALKDPIDNYTIESAAGPFQLSTTGSATNTRVLEFKEVLNGNLAASAGVTLFGAITVSAGVEVTIRSEWGKTITNSTEESTTTGFVFDDQGDGFYDEISFDYAVDDVYGTPVFGDPIGRTSCPHEEGTQYVDLPEIVALTPVKYATGANNELEFTLTLRNKSESNDTRTYMLDYIEQSDEFGAQVFKGANPFAGTIPFTIPAGGSINTTVRVVKSPGSSQFSYEGLQFDLYPDCEPLFRSSTFISAYFENSCPNINMPAPLTDWIANSDNNNLIPITMDGYDLNPDVDLIKLVYSEIGLISWKNTNIEVSEFSIQSPPYTYQWDISGIPDGEYLIRWELYCGESVNVSTRICGLIDRKAPSVFGNEEPRDDLFDPGDVISVEFDEEVDLSTLQNGNYYVTNVTTGTPVPATITQVGSEVFVGLGIYIDNLYNQLFEVGLISVGDIYGNYRTDTVKWDFVVSEPDSDGDRVGDLSDRCPGGDDKRDTDMDGLPDDCDCLPTIPQNGRSLTKAAMDFDGVDDYITIDSAYVGTINNFSYELWVNPTSNIPSGAVETNGGVVPYFTDNIPHAIFPTQGSVPYGPGHSTPGIAVGKNGIIVFEHAGFYFPAPLVHYQEIQGWTHVALVYENRQPKLYLNGELVKQGLLSGAIVHPSSRIGGYSWGPSNPAFFKGKMDEVRYWNYSLSQSEIQARMHEELTSNETGLITYFDFNEGTPFGHNEDLTAIVDKSSNSLDGTLSGFTKSGTSSNWITIPITEIDAPYDLCINCVDTLNTAMDFDGANDLISLDSTFSDVHTNFSYELWVNPQDSIFPTAFQTNGGLIPLVEDYTPFLIFPIQGGVAYGTGHATSGVIVGKNGIIVAEHSDNYFVSPLVHYVSISGWTHIAIVYENNQSNLYINGAFVKQGLPSGMSFVHPSGLIGGSSPGFHFNGKLDDLRYWDQTRTADQIANNLFIEMLGTESGLASCYDFNEGTASADNSALNSIVDLSGNGNTGTLLNFNKTGGYSNWVASPLNFRIDADEDGRPDACDNCIPPINLMLENQALNGMYMARDKITLGNGITFPLNADVIFRTPELELFDSVNAPAGVNILVNPKPCEEE